MTYFWNSIRSTVSANFMFLDTAKEIWEVVRDNSYMKKNVSRVFEVYEDLFSIWQGNKNLEDYNSHFKNIIDELN